ncbi:MAG: DUF2341 domain-containing protein [Nannocystaceae bacterium]
MTIVRALDITMVIAGAGLGLACQLDTDSEGGTLMLGRDTETGTGDASGIDSADSTGVELPEGPRRRRLDIDAAFAGGPGNATLLVVLDPSRIEYDDTQPDGRDLRFFSADDGTRYSAQIERWEPGGISVVWVRLPEPILPDHLWMDYGDGEPFPAQDGDVWDESFDAVWHMDALGTAILDSSGTGNPLVAMNFTGELQADGFIGGGVTIDDTANDAGSSDGPLEVSEVGTLQLGDAMTLEAWVSVPETEVTAPQFAVLADGAVELRTREPSNARPSMTVRTTGGPQRVEAGGSLGETWTYLVATYRSEDGTLLIHRNGAPEMSLVVAAQDRQLEDATHVLRVGAGMIGSLDEVRISSVARSPSWIALQYASMTDAVLSYGPPQER